MEHDARALQATAGLAPDAAEAALDELLRARLLRPAATAQRFEFTHALVREVVHDESNVLRRARLHRRAAEALSALGEDSHLEEIGMHLFEAASAADAQRAADMLERAGRRALDRLAYEDAADRFDRALDALELAGAEDDCGPVLLARGDALARAGEPDAARGSFTAARTLALRRSDPELLANAALGFAGLGIAIVGLDTQAIARLEEALDRVADAALRSRLQARLAVELYYAPDRARSEALSAEAVATAEESGDAVALASALGARHVALWRPDRVEERLAVAHEMTAAARAAGDRHTELQAQNWRVCDLFELGDMTAWREEVARHARLADELRLPAFQWYTPLWAAVDAILAGRYDEAERLAADAEEAGRRAGDRNAELFAHPGALRRPNPARGLRSRPTSSSFRTRSQTPPPGSPTGAATPGSSPAGGDIERARSELDAVMALPHAFDTNWLSLQAECAETAVLVGDPPTQPRSTSALRPTRVDQPPPAGPSPTTERSTDTSAASQRFSAGRKTRSATSRTPSASTRRSAARCGARTPSETCRGSPPPAHAPSELGNGLGLADVRPPRAGFFGAPASARLRRSSSPTA